MSWRREWPAKGHVSKWAAARGQAPRPCGFVTRTRKEHPGIHRAPGLGSSRLAGDAEVCPFLFLSLRPFLSYTAHTLCYCLSVFPWARLSQPKRATRRDSESCSVVSDPMAYTVRGMLQAGTLGWEAFSFCRDLPNPGIKPRSPALRADSSAEPQGSPRILE